MLRIRRNTDPDLLDQRVYVPYDALWKCPTCTTNQSVSLWGYRPLGVVNVWLYCNNESCGYEGVARVEVDVTVTVVEEVHSVGESERPR